MNVWVAEYSPRQKVFHIDTLERVLETNRQTVARGLEPGYVILCIAATSEAAHAFAEKWEAEHGN